MKTQRHSTEGSDSSGKKQWTVRKQTVKIIIKKKKKRNKRQRRTHYRLPSTDFVRICRCRCFQFAGPVANQISKFEFAFGSFWFPNGNRTKAHTQNILVLYYKKTGSLQLFADFLFIFCNSSIYSSYCCLRSQKGPPRFSH